jgi:hypothetical protein
MIEMMDPMHDGWGVVVLRTADCCEHNASEHSQTAPCIDWSGRLGDGAQLRPFRTCQSMGQSTHNDPHSV